MSGQAWCWAKLVTAVAVGVLLLGPLSQRAAAEFPPEGAVADPDNPSKADKTTINRYPGMTTRTIDHYYYDCLKKKWVWVSQELWKKEGNDPEVLTPNPHGQGGDLDSSPYPPGASKQGDNPNQRYDPKSGNTYNYDPRTDAWTDSFTGRVVSHKLCPPCPPCPERSDSGGGINLGIGIGVGGGHREGYCGGRRSHEKDRHKDKDAKKQREREEQREEEEREDKERSKSPGGGCGPH